MQIYIQFFTIPKIVSYHLLITGYCVYKFELFYDYTAYEIFVAHPKGIRDRNGISWHYKHYGAK